MRFSVEQLDGNRLLVEWSWICREPMALVARNGFGDLFLRTAQGGIACLNIGKGTLDAVAASELGFEELLRDPAQREHWFAEQQVQAFAERGLKPNNLQCVGFKVPVVFAEAPRSLTTPMWPTYMSRFHSWVICTDRFSTLLTVERSD